MNFPRALLALALLAALTLPAQAARVTVAVTVTNAPTHGLTFVLNGETRTWTTNAPSSMQMRLSATNAVSATNLYTAIAARPWTGKVTTYQTATTNVTMYGAEGQAMVASLPSSVWGYFTVTTNATTPGEITRAAYATVAATGSNALSLGGVTAAGLTVSNDARYLGIGSNAVSATYATTAGNASGVVASVLAPYVLANNGAATNLTIVGAFGPTNGILSAANAYTDGATNGNVASATTAATASSLTAAGATAAYASNETYRIFLISPSGIVASSNQFVLNPWGLGADANSYEVPFPSRFRYIKNMSVVVNGLSHYGETNWVGPTVKFADPRTSNATPVYESDHGANNFGGMFAAWTNMPTAAFQRTLYGSGASKVGIIWKLTNSIALPADWYANASTNASDCFWFMSGKIINANTTSMSNGVSAVGYIEFSTQP